MLSVAKDAYSNNCCKATPYAQECLLNHLSIILFFVNSSSKASKLLFIFVHISMGHAHFSTDEIPISCELDRLIWVYLSCEMAVNMARKAWFEVYGVLLRSAVFTLTNDCSKELETCMCK